MTLTECKNKVAQDRGFKDWAGFKRNYSFFPERYHNEVSTLYAIEKVKEALNLAAERAKVKGIPMDDGGYLKMVDPESILSLEIELVSKIKNDK